MISQTPLLSRGGVARSAGVVLVKEQFLEQPPRLRQRRNASRLFVDWRSHPALTKAGTFTFPNFTQAHTQESDRNCFQVAHYIFVTIAARKAYPSSNPHGTFCFRHGPMARTSETPVLIVGGGAVGCVLSMELARRGVPYRCIERNPGPGRESRAIAMHARTVELLDLVDKELSRRIFERDLRCKGYVMHFLREGQRTEVRPGLDYTTVDSRYNCIFAHNQSETETFVRDFTQARFGKTIEYNTTFHDLTLEPDAVTARVTHTDRGDEEELIRCRYLVAADGINSRVRRGLGMSVKGKDYAGSFFQNPDIHLNGFPDWTDHFHYCVGTDHFLMVAPLPGGHFRLLLSDRGEAADPSLTPQQAFLRVLSQHYDGITMGDVVWHSKWETWVRLADAFRHGNIFLAGEIGRAHV